MEKISRKIPIHYILIIFFIIMICILHIYSFPERVTISNQLNSETNSMHLQSETQVNFFQVYDNNINLYSKTNNSLFLSDSFNLDINTQEYSVFPLKNDLEKRILIISTKSLWIYYPFEFITYQYEITSYAESFMINSVYPVLNGQNLVITCSIDNTENDTKDRILLISEKGELLDSLNLSTTNLVEQIIPSPFSSNNLNSLFILSDNNSFNGTHSRITVLNYNIAEERFIFSKEYELGIFPGAFASITFIPPSKFAIAGDGYGYYIQYDIRLNKIEHHYQVSFFRGTGDEGLINGSSQIFYDKRNERLIWTLCTRIPHIDYGLMQFQYTWSDFNSLSKPFIEGNGGLLNTHRDVSFFGFIEKDKPFDIVISGYNLQYSRV